MKHAVPLILAIGVAAAVGCGGSGDGSSGDPSGDFQQPSLADELRDLSEGLPVDDQAPPSDPQAPPSDDQSLIEEGDTDLCTLLCSRPEVAACSGDCFGGCDEFRSEFGAFCPREADAYLRCLVARSAFRCEQDPDEGACASEVDALGQCRDQFRPDQRDLPNEPPPTAGTAPAEPAPAPGADADGGAAL